MDVVIIGAGPAGEAAASTLKKLSKDVNVTLVEKNAAGGLCLNKGCIPSKTLLEYVHKAFLAERSIKWDEIQKIKNDVIQTIRDALEIRLKREGVKILIGTAVFDGPSSLTVQTDAGKETIPFDKAIIATGSDIFFPPPLDQIRDQILNSDSLLEITKTPASMLIVGGGAVGCEFACLLDAAGCKVTLIEMKDSLLPGEDPAVAALLATVYEKHGIAVKPSTTIKEAKKTPSGWEVTLSNDEKIQVEEILCCAGRVPSFKSLNLEKTGLAMENGRIAVNANHQTSQPNIYAAGDVTSSRLAHHAAEQGKVAASHIAGQSVIPNDRFIPRCLYSWPEVASVGQYKWNLEEKNIPVKTSRAFFKGAGRALASGEVEGFVQIVSNATTGKICGAQIIGPQATELIHIFSVALKAGMTTKDLSEVIFAHPTLGEVIKDAAKK